MKINKTAIGMKAGIAFVILLNLLAFSVLMIVAGYEWKAREPLTYHQKQNIATDFINESPVYKSWICSMPMDSHSTTKGK